MSMDNNENQNKEIVEEFCKLKDRINGGVYFNEFKELLYSSDFNKIRNYEKFNKFNEYLDWAFENLTENIEEGEEFYRARCINQNGYTDLETNSNAYGQGTICGYPSEKMGVPPKTSSGRLNKEGTPILYVSNDISLCCSEIRPIFSELISVIKYKTIKKLKVLNFMKADFRDLDFQNKYVYIGFFEKLMFAMIEPVKEQNDESYIVTQYIAEYFKEKGADGIKYYTSNSSEDNKFNLGIFSVDKVSCNDEKSAVYRMISKSVEFQSLTDKTTVESIKFNKGKLSEEDINKMIRGLEYYKKS